MTRRAVLHLLRVPGVLAWRFFTGQALDGVARTDAGWFTHGYKTLDRDSAPRPPGTLAGEVGRDVKSFFAGWHDLLVGRALGRELEDVERQVLAEDDPGKS